jgi:hypothetical protein
MKTVVVDSYIAAVDSISDKNVVLDTEAAVSGLQSLAARPQELDQGSRTRLTAVLANLAAGLSDEGLSGTKGVRPTVSATLLTVADTLLVARAETLTSGQARRASTEQSNVELVSTVQGLMNLYVSNMVPGEFMSSVITERMTIVRTSVAKGDAVDNVLEFEVPSMPFDESPMRVSVIDSRSRSRRRQRRLVETATVVSDGLEDAEEVVFPQMLRVAGKFVDPQRVYTGNSTVAELGFASSTLLSDALLFDMTGPSSMDIVCGAGDAGNTTGADKYTSSIHFELPFVRAPEEEDTLLATVNSTSSVVQCVSGTSSRTVVVCNGADHIISCDGVEVTDKTLSCTQSVSQHLVCQSHVFQQAGAEEGTDCRVVGRSLTSVTCGCDMCAIRRRLEASSSSSSSLLNVQIVAMGEFVVSDFVKVNRAFSTVGNASTYTEARLVVGTIVSFVLFLLLVMGVSEWHIADAKMKEEVTAAKKRDGDGGYMKGLHAKSVMGMIIPKDDDEEGDRDDEDIDDDDDQLLLRYVESLFPAIFSSRSALGRFIDELIANHVLLSAFFSDTRCERLLSAYEFMSVLLQGFFAIAMVVNLDMGSQKGPNGESCDQYGSEVRCVEDSSLYDPSESACVWSADSQTCLPNNDATGNFLTTVYIVLLTIVLAIPLRLLHNILFDGALKAHNMGPDSAVESDRRRIEISANVNSLAQDQRQSESHETDASKSFVRSNFMHTVRTSLSFKRTISIPKKVRDLRRQVFSVDGTSTYGHRQHSMSKIADVPTFKRDDLIFARLHQDMHKYIKDCRLRRASYSTDRSVSVGRVREAAKLSANKGFCRAWRMDVIDNATGLPCTTVHADADESLAVTWDDKASMAALLHTLDEQGYDACNDLWGYDSAAAGAEVCRHLLLDLLGRNTARGKIFEVLIPNIRNPYRICRSWAQMRCVTSILRGVPYAFTNGPFPPYPPHLSVFSLPPPTYSPSPHQAKSNWHVRDGLVMTPHFKAAVFVASMLLNVYYVWAVILYGSIRGEQWQRTWMSLCACYTFFIIALEMTVEATMVGFVIPCQALGDVRSLQADLSMKLASTSVQQAFLNHAAKYNNGQGCVDVESQTVGGRSDLVVKDPSAFNATNFLFVSSRLAQAFPSLPESVLVEVFASVHPRYGLVTREREPELRNVSAALRNGAHKSMFRRMCLAASSFSLSGLLMWIGTQPVLFQKLLINLPMPLLSSMVAFVVYLTATMNLVVATSVLVLGGLMMVVGAGWIISTTHRTVRDSELVDIKHRAELTRINAEERRRRTNDIALVPKPGMLLKVMSRLMSSRTLGDVVPDVGAIGGSGGCEARTRRQSVVDPEFHSWDDGSDSMQVHGRLLEGTSRAAIMPASEVDAREAILLKERLDRTSARHRRSMMVHKEEQRRRLQMRLKGDKAIVDAELALPKRGRGARTILQTGRDAEDALDLEMARKQLHHRNKLILRIASKSRKQDFLASSSGSEDSAVNSDSDHDVFDGDDTGTNVVNAQGGVSAPFTPAMRPNNAAVAASRWGTLRTRRSSAVRLAFEHSSSSEGDASSLDYENNEDSDVRLPEATVVTKVIKRKSVANTRATTDRGGDANKIFATKSTVQKAKATGTGTDDGRQQQHQQSPGGFASLTVHDITNQVVSLSVEQELDAGQKALLSNLLEQDMSSDIDVDADVDNSSSSEED